MKKHSKRSTETKPTAMTEAPSQVLSNQPDYWAVVGLDVSDRQTMGRMIVSRLMERGLLASDGPRDPVRLGFPADAVERWFPNLYPAIALKSA